MPPISITLPTGDSSLKSASATSLPITAHLAELADVELVDEAPRLDLGALEDLVSGVHGADRVAAGLVAVDHLLVAEDPEARRGVLDAVDPRQHLVVVLVGELDLPARAASPCTALLVRPD